ncbi:hypothetical protein FS749_002474 [Ceratobasidium sp. UAMH 11750]|nr:hypothetical protein FS749_002474 [Ceratobasidium sp. UAMH 11750]
MDKSANPEDLVIKAAACTAFAGFLQAGEFTTASTSFDPNWDLCRGSAVAFPHEVTPNYMRLTLRGSKTDPTRKGVTIIITAVPDCPTCPISALLNMSCAFPTVDACSSLFAMVDGSPLHKDFFLLPRCSNNGGTSWLPCTQNLADGLPPRRFRCPHQATGFWTAVHAHFDELTGLHGAHYGGNTGWELWKDKAIVADQALFTGKTQFPGEAPMTFMDDN